jgi:maltooligosyltrehalose trehalohydrolase
MDVYNVHKRGIGVNFHSPGVADIRVWAPYARSVSIDVSEKGQIKLERDHFGYWHTTSPELYPGDKYFVVLNGKEKYPDPASLSQSDGVHEASQCIDLGEIKSISSGRKVHIPLADLIIYELHTGTFSPEGTFKGIEKKLDYLADFGVNAIELMPVAAFPGTRNWGYDGVFPFAVQQSYGGAAGLAQLVRASHERGIAVILDVVYNHLGPEGNYLDSFGPYFTGKYQTPWGKAINFDDAWCDGVRHFFIENALMWLRDFQIDGLRLDAVHAIKDFGPVHFLAELHNNVQQLNRQTGANHFLIAESDLNDSRFINPVNKGGFGMDAQWCDEFHHALHALMTGEQKGYYSDFGSLDQMIKSFNHAYVFDGNYSRHRKKSFGTSTQDQPGYRFVVFTQNHDQVGNRMLGDRLTNLLDFESLKLAAASMFVSPFIPMLFMGEEFAEETPFLYFISHGDDHLVEMVRKGRKKEFRDFIKDADPPDPQSEETFQKSRLQWDYAKQNQKKLMYEYYKTWIALRKQIPLLRPGNRDGVVVRKSENGKGIVMIRENGKDLLCAVLNYADEPIVEVLSELKNTKLSLVLYSAHQKWGGSVNDTTIPLTTTQNGRVQLKLRPKSMALFTGLLH